MGQVLNGGLDLLISAMHQVNLFLAVLKTKFGKAQSLFRTRAQVNQTQRKNTIRKMLEWAKLQWTEFKARQLASASQLVGQLRRPSKLASVGPNVSLGQSGDQHVGGSRKRKTVSEHLLKLLSRVSLFNLMALFDQKESCYQCWDKSRLLHDGLECLKLRNRAARFCD